MTSTGANAASRVRDCDRGMTPEVPMRDLERFCRADQARPRAGSISLENARSASEMVVAEEALKALPGTVSIFVNPQTKTAFVVCQPGATSPERLLRALADAGLQPSAT